MGVASRGNTWHIHNRPHEQEVNPETRVASGHLSSSNVERRASRSPIVSFKVNSRHTVFIVAYQRRPQTTNNNNNAEINVFLKVKRKRQQPAEPVSDTVRCTSVHLENNKGARSLEEASLESIINVSTPTLKFISLVRRVYLRTSLLVKPNYLKWDAN